MPMSLFTSFTLSSTLTVSTLHPSSHAFCLTANPGNKNPSKLDNLIRQHRQHLLPSVIPARTHKFSCAQHLHSPPRNPIFLFPICLKGGQESSGLNLGKKISVPRDVMLEELSLLTNRGSKMFKLRQKRVEKFIYENHPDVFSDSSMVSSGLWFSKPNASSDNFFVSSKSPIYHQPPLMRIYKLIKPPDILSPQQLQHELQPTSESQCLS